MVVRDLAYSEGWFYAVGYSAQRMLVSRDAINWTGTGQALDPALSTDVLAIIDGIFSRVAVDPGFKPKDEGAMLRLLLTRFLRRQG